MQQFQKGVWLRSIDSAEARALPGTEGVSVLPDEFFWSPDSDFIGFVSTDAAWSKNGELFYLAADRHLMTVPYRATAATFKPGEPKQRVPSK